jgi:GNAT superfamily N-acetyltransferase
MPPPNTPNPAYLSNLNASHRTWTRDGFLISTDPSLIPNQTLNAAFASPMCYWAKSLPEEAIRAMLTNSLNFGLYSPTSSLPPINDEILPDSSAPQDPSQVLHEIAEHLPHQQTLSPEGPDAGAIPAFPNRPSSQPVLIGYARLVTDKVTFAYLTDVYILPAWQSQGLGKWLVQCVQEVLESMPYLRRSVALISGHADGEGNGDGTKKGSTDKFYEKFMNMTLMSSVVGGPKVIQWKGPGNAY